ncbi:GTP-binding protein HSR1, partial [Citrobacter sp. wls714]
FGDAVVEVIDAVIDLAPLPQAARYALQTVTHTVARAARTVWSFFFG